jgi:hypothetical protein
MSVILQAVVAVVVIMAAVLILLFFALAAVSLLGLALGMVIKKLGDK